MPSRDLQTPVQIIYTDCRQYYTQNSKPSKGHCSYYFIHGTDIRVINYKQSPNTIHDHIRQNAQPQAPGSIIKISPKQSEKEKRNIQVEVRKLEYQNEKLKEENNRLHNFLHNILQTLKKFFHRLLKIGTEKDKDKVISEIKEYHKHDLYDNFDLHDKADNTSKEEEIKDYLYTKNYEYDDKDFDI